MANQFGVNNAVYLATDGWAMAQYAAKTAATYTPVRRINDPIVAAGPWMGTRMKISFVSLYNDERGEVVGTKFAPLFKLANQSDLLSYEELFHVYVNIIRLICPGKDQMIKNLFTNRGYDVILLDTMQTRIWYHKSKLKIRALEEEDLAEIDKVTRKALTIAQDNNENCMRIDDEAIADDEIQVNSSMLNVVIGVYFNLITKKITTLNIDNWYKERIRKYSCNTYTDHDESVYNSFRPSVRFAKAVNSGVARFFTFKRLVFNLVREFSVLSEHPLYEVSLITIMDYFRMAELTSFSMIVEYILTQNPVVLAWEGIGKDLVDFKAALDKFRSFGKDAPFCKLMYPPEELTEFSGKRLGCLAYIAHDIAIFQGRPTTFTFSGSGPVPRKTLATVRRIITLYNNTSVAHSRVGGFASLDPDSLLANALNSRAVEDDKQQKNTDDELVIPGVDVVKY